MSTAVTVKQAAAMLKDADRIWILTHHFPDGDTLGSGFALSGAPGSALSGRKVAWWLCVGGGGQAGLQAVAMGATRDCAKPVRSVISNSL